MGAAAQLGGEVPHPQEAHLIAVFLAEQGHGTGGLGVLQAHDAGLDHVIVANLAIHQSLDLNQLCTRYRLEV